MKAYNRIKIIDLLILFFLLFITSNFFFRICKFPSVFSLDNVLLVIFYLFLSLFLTFLCTSPFIITYLIIRNSILSRFYKVFDKNDLTKYSDYYRDIIKSYSPAVLSYIDDFNLKKADIYATLLNLKQKNIIDIENSNLIKLPVNTDLEKLTKNEKYIYDCIINAKIDDTFSSTVFTENVIADCIDQKLIINDDKTLKKAQKKDWSIIIFSLIFTILFFLLSMNLDFIVALNENVKSLVLVLSILFTFVSAAIFIFSIVKLISDVAVLNKYSHFRTKNGALISQQLKGLQNFLSHYSLIDELKSQSLKLWNDYLIYSVIFEQNKEIVKEFDKMSIISPYILSAFDQSGNDDDDDEQ